MFPDHSPLWSLCRWLRPTSRAARADGSDSGDAPALLVQTVPECRYTLEHLVAGFDEGIFVHYTVEVEFFQFFLGVLRVLTLDTRVPGKERQG